MPSFAVCSEQHVDAVYLPNGMMVKATVTCFRASAWLKTDMVLV